MIFKDVRNLPFYALLEGVGFEGFALLYLTLLQKKLT